MNDRKIIGIEQFMPMEVINQEIVNFLENDAVDIEETTQKMLNYNKGENRARKAARCICTIVSNKTPVLSLLKKTYTGSQYAQLPLHEQNLIALSMMSLRYPIMYDTLCAFAKLFKLQDSVNRPYIKQSMATVYGTNRILDIALDALLRMVVDAGVINRIKIGLYGKTKPVAVNELVTEIWIYTHFKVSGSKPISVDDLRFVSWMQYLMDIDIDWEKSKLLKIRKETEYRIWIE